MLCVCNLPKANLSTFIFSLNVLKCFKIDNIVFKHIGTMIPNQNTHLLACFLVSRLWQGAKRLKVATVNAFPLLETAILL